jgi:hypothetical protein
MKIFNKEDIGKEFTLRLLPNIGDNGVISTIEITQSFYDDKGNEISKVDYFSNISSSFVVKKIGVFGLLNDQLNIIRIPENIHKLIKYQLEKGINLYDLKGDISINFNISNYRFENIRIERDPKNIIWDGREETKEDVKNFIKSKNLILKNCFDLNVIRANNLSELGIY